MNEPTMPHRADRMNEIILEDDQPVDSDKSGGDGYEGREHGPLISGTVVVCFVLGLCALLIASAWLYHYDQQRLPREFWGFESPRIFRDAPTVTAVLIQPEATGRESTPQYYDNLYVVGPLRYEQLKKFDIVKLEEPKKPAAGTTEAAPPEEKKPEDPKKIALRNKLDSLRQSLRDYRNYESGAKAWQQPEWRFGLIFVDGNYTASILFDAECKVGRPQSIEKQISTAPMSKELQEFFLEIFPEAKDMKSSGSKNIFAQPLIETPKTPTPQATATGTGATTTTDADVLTQRNGTTTGAVPTTPQTTTTGTSTGSTTVTGTATPAQPTLTIGAPALSNPGATTIKDIPDAPSPTATIAPPTSTGPRVVGPALPSDLTPQPLTTTTTGTSAPTTTTGGK